MLHVTTTNGVQGKKKDIEIEKSKQIQESSKQAQVRVAAEQQLSCPPTPCSSPHLGIRCVSFNYSCTMHCRCLHVMHQLQHLGQVSLCCFKRHRATHQLIRIGCNMFTPHIVGFTPGVHVNTHTSMHTRMCKHKHTGQHILKVIS